ncbi:hypothetical protein B5E53_02410 [Eubacterium sp. An11]|uniref:hypothetical protein n=1 Tax=Eubacterium sp. An11 TaxID=1965542 RepID=UPI000B39EFA8|nr:hypothetical protein [Eubacterium sp. An11]OUQ69613.1 hypothetical protein B5E53_02410 [Eubacterium sp. An11]
MQKIKSKIKLYSFIIFPAIIIIALKFLMGKSVLKFNFEHMDTLISIIVTLIGILLTILTIYLSFPKNDKIVERMKKTKHNEILLKNIFFGICLLSLAVLLWMFSSYYEEIVILSVASFSNIIICSYYLYKLGKL